MPDLLVTLGRPGQVIPVDGDPRDIRIKTWRDLTPEEIFDDVDWHWPERPGPEIFDWRRECRADFPSVHLVGRGRGTELCLLDHVA